jgi:predicted DNA-binding antitoxin AbrB/MazE fold protein
MTREVEAIYEDGVLKPVEPLQLAEKQRVKVRVSDMLDRSENSGARHEEMAWIGKNAHRYKGEWVAVQGSELVGHGPDLRAAEAEALKNGIEHPLFFSVPEHLGEPSIEWL